MKKWKWPISDGTVGFINSLIFVSIIIIIDILIICCPFPLAHGLPQ